MPIAERRPARLARRRTHGFLLLAVAALCLAPAGPASGETASVPLRLLLELAVLRVGDAELPVRLLLEAGEAPAGPAIPGMPGAAPAAGIRLIALPAIHGEGRRYFLRGETTDAEIVPTGDDVGPRRVAYRAPQRPALRLVRQVSGDAAEATVEAGEAGGGSDEALGEAVQWTLVSEPGLEHTLRAGRAPAEWRAVALRDPVSGTTAAVEHDDAGRLVRIAVDGGLEWLFDYEPATAAGTAPRLLEIRGVGPVSVAGDTLYRARLEWSGDRLLRVRAASRTPAGVQDVELVYSDRDPTGRGPTLREIRTPRGEIDPRFEYDPRGAVAVLSVVPRDDAYDTRYRVTTRLLPEYVGEDLLEDSLGRRTLLLDADGRRRFRLRVEQGRLLREDGAPLDTAGEPFLIVLAPDGEIFASRGDYSAATKMHHSSFLAGEPVAAAGEIVARGGKPVRISSRSGHYKPPLCLLDQLRAELERRGLDLSGVPFEKGY